MFELAMLFGTTLLAITGYVLSRDFVRRRLRFVDAIRSPLAPIAAGIGAFLLAFPLSFLPLITLTPAVVLGFACAFGTASGVRALRRADYNSSRHLLP
jgi:uncharacterized membrane protein